MSSVNTLEATSSLDKTLEHMRARLNHIMPDFEIQAKAEIAHRINLIKQEMNAVILGHNYMEPALYHSVPDYVGDSLHLSGVSAQTEADVIVFCGVWFMGETAKILSPDKTVLVPSNKAGCSLAEGISREDVIDLKRRYPGAPVVSYVNTYAAVKAESDYCYTSGNAGKVLRHLLDKGHQRIIFVPDEYLACNIAADLDVAYFTAGDEVAEAKLAPEKPAVIGWNVRCEVRGDFQQLLRPVPALSGGAAECGADGCI